MDPATIALVLKLTDLAIFGLTRLPQRNEEREAAVQRIKDMITAGQQPSDADFKAAMDAIDATSAERDNLIALKP